MMSIDDLREAIATVAAAVGRSPNALAAPQPTLDQVAELLRLEGNMAPKLILTTRVRPSQEQRQ